MYCGAKTKLGRRCRNKTAKNTKYCQVHTRAKRETKKLKFSFLSEVNREKMRLIFSRSFFQRIYEEYRPTETYTYLRKQYVVEKLGFLLSCFKIIKEKLVKYRDYYVGMYENSHETYKAIMRKILKDIESRYVKVYPFPSIIDTQSELFSPGTFHSFGEFYDNFRDIFSDVVDGLFSGNPVANLIDEVYDFIEDEEDTIHAG